MSAHRKVLQVLLILGSSLLLPLPGKSQIAFLDTASASLHHKPKFYVDLSSYNSIVSNQSAIFTDLLIGLAYNHRLYFSAGISTLNTDVVSPQFITTGSGSYTTNAQLNMFLFILSAEYVFSRDYPWTFSVLPFKVGVGSAYYSYISEPDKRLMHINENALVTYQPEATASYNILKWIGLGGSLGYRFTLFSSTRIYKDLNSFTYSFGVKLFFDPIYNAVFPNGIFGKKKDEKDKPN